MTLSVLQLIVSILLIILILLQERSAGMSGIFGGGDAGGFYQARRGFEHAIFWATIVLALVFAGLAVFQIVG